jgi:hypothetical protein
VLKQVLKKAGFTCLFYSSFANESISPDVPLFLAPNKFRGLLGTFFSGLNE